MRSAERGILATFLLTGSLACHSTETSAPVKSETQPLPRGIIVSDPGSRATASSNAAQQKQTLVAGSTAYVSASPGTFPGGITAQLVNYTRSGPTTAVTVRDGGFDPTAIAAEADDEIHITVISADGSSNVYSVKVPPRRPPNIVRTSPQKGRTDVALNIQIEIIFSEPVDPSSVNTATLKLVSATSSVAGNVSLAGDGLTATFIPASSLLSGTDYTFTVEDQVKDLDGDKLEAADVTTFRTQSNGNVRVTVSTSGSDPDADGYILTVNMLPYQVIPSNGTFELNVPGAYRIGLLGIADNCARVPDQFVNINGYGNTAAFVVLCQPKASFVKADIAFASDRDGNTEIYSMGSNGVTRLTFNQGFDGYPVWSPDAKRIAFVSARERDGNDKLIEKVDLYVMDADGSNVVRLTTTGYVSRPTWSPDGNLIAYAYDPHPYGASEIAIIDSRVGEPSRRLLQLYKLDAKWPAWSPDGAWIAFTAGPPTQNYRSGGSLQAIRPDGSGRRIILDVDPGHLDMELSFPAWSPDGHRLAVARCDRDVDGGCITDIVLAAADGSGVQSGIPAQGYIPVWDPAGETLAFESYNCGCILAASLDGTIRGTIANGMQPSWKPRQ